MLWLTAFYPIPIYAIQNTQHIITIIKVHFNNQSNHNICIITLISSIPLIKLIKSKTSFMFDTIEIINNNLNQDHTNFNYHIRARNNKILIEFLRL